MFETDETLIRRILQGKDREAGELLVERHYKRIYKEIYLKTSDEELAKDLTQEAFIQILKNLYQFDSKRRPLRRGLQELPAIK